MCGWRDANEGGDGTRDEWGDGPWRRVGVTYGCQGGVDSPHHEAFRINGSSPPRMTGRRLSGQGKRDNHGWRGAAHPFFSSKGRAIAGRCDEEHRACICAVQEVRLHRAEAKESKIKRQF